jgi:spore germination cell wall hydrolase CwlJ-like protein
MGFRLANRKWFFAAAAFVAPVMAMGYYAGHPENFNFTVSATLSGVGSMHGRHLSEPTLHAAKDRIPVEAAHLFDAPLRGPRADRYMQLTSSDRGLKPEPAPDTKMAKASQADMTVTGAIQASAPNGAANSGVKQLPLLGSQRPEVLSLVPSVPVAERTSASLFLSMLSRTMPASLPEELALSGSTDLPTQNDGKGRLAFKGETEGEYQARQRRCLATAIYFEARGEPVQGQLAVAQVVMNRVRSSLYPDTICGVVYQGQHRRTGCQFSFTCDGHTDVPKDKERWRQANELSAEFTKGDTFLGDIGYATHYHANYVSPRWRRELNKIKKVGRHIFYRVRGEQVEDVFKEESPARGLAFSKSG